MTTRPTLNKKGVARLLGATEATVKKLIDSDELPGYTMNVAGDGWELRVHQRGAADIFFQVEDVLRVRDSRPKREPTRSRELDPALLPESPVIPELTLEAASARLEIKRGALWTRVRNLEIPCYVMNQQGTGWVLYGTENAAPGATLYFRSSDIDAYAPEIDESFRNRQEGKPGRKTIYGPRTKILVYYPADLLKKIKARTDTPSEWLIEAAREKLEREP